jgi:hypothetical protein
VSATEVPTSDARGVSRVGAVDRGSYELDNTDIAFANGFE